MPQLAYILSLPRSGSSVLAAMLEKRKGIVSAPESSFPQILGAITKKERADKRWLAALYLGSTCTPTPLNLDEAEACMHGSDQEILTRLGLALGSKFGRTPEQIKVIIWKTPRTISMQATTLSTNGKFIILRRNPHNVFESQFRVGFGVHNRRPFRFAIFRESYEYVFSGLPRERLLEIEYDTLPETMDNITRFLGIPDTEEWMTQSGSADLAAVTCDHMADITKEFRNGDPEKRARLKPEQVSALNRAINRTRWLRPFLGPIRRHFDVASLNHMRSRAKRALEHGQWEPV